MPRENIGCHEQSQSAPVSARQNWIPLAMTVVLSPDFLRLHDRSSQQPTTTTSNPQKRNHANFSSAGVVSTTAASLPNNTHGLSRSDDQQ
jgi:hypothetical protein